MTPPNCGWFTSSSRQAPGDSPPCGVDLATYWQLAYDMDDTLRNV
jgi:hypothetical protein